ncbi:MAG: GtrA family protein [Syntrophotaleaceae bacterium]
MKIALASGIQFIKFSLIGFVNTGLHYLVFLFLFGLFGVHYLIASTTGYGVGLMNSFILNRKWTFSRAGGKKQVEFGRFLIVNLAALLINLGILKYLVQNRNWLPEMSQLLAIAFSMSLNFIGNKFWTFRD